jgi:hypothetical protein
MLSGQKRLQSGSGSSSIGVVTKRNVDFDFRRVICGRRTATHPELCSSSEKGARSLTLRP